MEAETSDSANPQEEGQDDVERVNSAVSNTPTDPEKPPNSVGEETENVKEVEGYDDWPGSHDSEESDSEEGRLRRGSKEKMKKDLGIVWTFQEKLKLSFIVHTSAIGGLLFGYHTGIISGVLLILEKDFELDNAMRKSLTVSLTISAAIANVLYGMVLDRVGRKIGVLVTAIVYLISDIVMATAPNLEMLLVGRIISGIGTGMVCIAVPLYVAEVSPKERRGKDVCIFQFYVTSSILMSAVSGGLLQSTENGWRYMFGVGGVMSLIQIIFCFFLPESPRYSVVDGKPEMAEQMLKKYRPAAYNVDEELQLIKTTLDKEKEFRGLAESWSMMLKVPQVRNGLIMNCLVAMFTQACGINTVIYFAGFILKSAGFNREYAIWLTCFPFAINYLFTYVGYFTFETVGRRKMTGLGFLCVAVACAVLSVGFMLLDVLSPVTLPKWDNGSMGTCRTREDCNTCLDIEQKTCGFCAKKTDDFIEASCVPLTEINGNFYAKTGRCSQNSTLLKDDKVVFYDEYCPNKYSFLLLIGLMLFVGGFAPAVGPILWISYVELMPMWARANGASVAGLVMWSVNIIVGATFMQIIRGLQAYGIFMIFLVISVTATAVVMMKLPEMKGVPLEEAELMFMDIDPIKKQQALAAKNRKPAAAGPRKGKKMR